MDLGSALLRNLGKNLLLQHERKPMKPYSWYQKLCLNVGVRAFFIYILQAPSNITVFLSKVSSNTQF